MDLSAELAVARERFVARNPLSHAAHEAAASAMPGGNTRTTLFYGPFPVTMANGAGCRMTDLIRFGIGRTLAGHRVCVMDAGPSVMIFDLRSTRRRRSCGTRHPS